MLKDYYQVRDWLERFIPHTYSRKNLGLERIEFLLKLLGNPQNKFKSIHVGGTSGKGSTAFYIAKLLQHSKSEIRNPKSETNHNFQKSKIKKHKFSKFDIRASNFPTKVGLHLSPHLIYLGERMQINGVAISTQRLVDLINAIKPFVEQMSASQVGKPSYFEILVAASFKYFADEKVDWAVVEVGLGGKFDATNVLMPKVSVITNVGLDHTEILGKTVEKIAKEKAGIIKKNTPIVTGATGKSLNLIKKAAKQQKSKLITLDTQFIEKLTNFDSLESSNIYKEVLRDTPSQLALSNELLAIETISSLKIPVSDKSFKKAFEERLSGRMEEIERGVFLDSAHNVDKIRFLLQLFSAKKVILVLAFKKGKEWKKMVDLLLDELPITKVVATEFLAMTDMGNLAAVSAKQIKKYIEAKSKIEVESQENSQQAVFEAIKSKISDESVLITGSLFLVGEARTLWFLSEF